MCGYFQYMKDKGERRQNRKDEELLQWIVLATWKDFPSGHSRYLFQVSRYLSLSQT